jgi:predicted component of type VI protein secretion system
MLGKDSPPTTHRELIEQAEELLRPQTFNEEADTRATALAVIALYRLLDERLPGPD